MMETDDTQPAADTTAEPSPQATQPATTLGRKQSGNQLTTALIVVIVVLLFVMLMMSMNGQLFQSGNKEAIDYSELAARNAQLRTAANAERARRGLPPLPEDANTARIAADRIQRDATTLATLASQWQNTLEEKDQQLRALEAEANAQRSQMASLYKRINELEGQLASAANSATEIQRLTNDLQMANNQLDNFRKQLADMQGRPSNEQFATLRKQLNESLDKCSKLEMQIDGLLTASQNKIDKSEQAGLMKELDQLRADNRTQRYEIQRLRAELDRSSLFIEAHKDLPAQAARLFAKLRTLENTNPQQLAAAYENIRGTLGAEIIHRQTFAKGSSQITFDREKIIQDIVEKRKDAGSFFLVVGYASKSGGSDNNSKLSASRATTVASIVNILKADDQQVRAVYLGETARFSPTVEIENQICEVWEIKK